MRWLLSIFSVFFAMTAIAQFELGGQRPRAASLSVVPESAKLGTMRQGQMRRVDLTIRNSSVTPVDLISASPDCGCTVPDFSSIRLAPGKSTQIGLTFYSGSMRGHVEKSVFVAARSMNGNGSETTIGIRIPLYATIIPDVEVAPRDIDFRADRRSSRTIDITIAADRRGSLTLDTVETTATALEATLFKGEDYSRIIVRFEPQKWIGSSGGTASVVLYTTGSAEPIVMIPVKIIPAND